MELEMRKVVIDKEIISVINIRNISLTCIYVVFIYANRNLAPSIYLLYIYYRCNA